MAVPHGGDTKPTRGSVDCVGPSMETGEVVTREAVTIIREMRLEVMEKLMVTETWVIKETKGVTETQIIKVVTETCRARHEETTERTTKTTEIKTETREIEGEVDEVKDKHTQVEIVGDNEGELGECFVARYEQQDGLLKGQGETLCPLEADRDQVGPIVPNEVEGMTEVNGCTRSLGA